MGAGRQTRRTRKKVQEDNEKERAGAACGGQKATVLIMSQTHQSSNYTPRKQKTNKEKKRLLELYGLKRCRTELRFLRQLELNPVYPKTDFRFWENKTDKKKAMPRKNVKSYNMQNGDSRPQTSAGVYGRSNIKRDVVAEIGAWKWKHRLKMVEPRPSCIIKRYRRKKWEPPRPRSFEDTGLTKLDKQKAERDKRRSLLRNKVVLKEKSRKRTTDGARAYVRIWKRWSEVPHGDDNINPAISEPDPSVPRLLADCNVKRFRLQSFQDCNSLQKYIDSAGFVGGLQALEEEALGHVHVKSLLEQVGHGTQVTGELRYQRELDSAIENILYESLEKECCVAMSASERKSSGLLKRTVKSSRRKSRRTKTRRKFR